MSSNYINIVIPMAGDGNRFKIAGFDVPKPFIEFKEKMMIEHVLSGFKNLNNFNAKFFLIIQEDFKIKQQKQLEKLNKNYSVEFITVPKLTMGAAITCLAAHRALDKNYPVIFADSDNIFNNDTIINFINDTKNRDLDGSLLTFKSNSPMYSYVLTDNNQKLLETKEKQIISDNAICGLYYFKNVEDFVNSTIDLVISNDLQCGEFYMSNVYNYLSKYKKNIGIYTINTNNFVCVGTPEQLQEYLGSNPNVKT